MVPNLKNEAQKQEAKKWFVRFFKYTDNKQYSLADLLIKCCINKLDAESVILFVFVTLCCFIVS